LCKEKRKDSGSALTVYYSKVLFLTKKNNIICCRAFLVAVLNDARQKIVEIKFPVKKRVKHLQLLYCSSNYCAYAEDI